MKSIALKERRAAVIRILDLARAYEVGEADDHDAEVFSRIVVMLGENRRGKISQKVTHLAKRRENATLSRTAAVNLMLFALDCISTVTRLDSPRLANALNELRTKLLTMASNSAVAPPPAPPPPPGTRR